MTMQAFKHLNLTYLESLIGDDDDTKMVIFSTLLEEVPEEIAKMEELIEKEDWHTLHEVSHKFKSTLGYIGNDTIFDANQEMMMSARNMKNLHLIPSLLITVKETWALIEPEVIAALEDVS